MSDDIIRWEDPPIPRTRKFDLMVERLRAHPGRWALVQEGVSIEHAEQSTAQALRRKGLRVVTRRQDKTSAGVWACWPESE